MKKETICVHGSSYSEPSGALSTPIYQSATFRHKGVDEINLYSYSRLSNPTRSAVESTIANLENGIDAIAFSTGLAAITVLFENFSPNDHIIATEDLYGGSIRLFRTISQKNGLKFSFVDTSNLDLVKKSITKNTKAIFVETPTNPMMIVSSVSKIAKIAKEHNLMLIVDNTFLTPYFLQPLNLGAAIVVHSGTKFLGGHNDTLAGFLIFKDKNLADNTRIISKTIGACLAPFDSWLLLRGIKTLGLRMEQSQKNAVKIVNFLKTHKKVKKVFYAGLKDSKGYDDIKKEATGFGSMISFEVDSFDTVQKALKNFKMISFAESLGGTETLITFPANQTHGDVPKLERDKRGINDKLLRLSVGIENADDIIADLKQGLE